MTIPTQKPLHVISLGAGVQSSAMALMAARGEITPMPVAAIFADTQAEPQGVYTWLDWLEKQLPFPIYRVSKGNLAKAATKVSYVQRERVEIHQLKYSSFPLGAGPREGGSAIPAMHIRLPYP